MQACRWMLAAAVLCGVAACERAPEPAAPTAATAGTAPAELSSGIDVVGMDRSVKPGNDFEAYANGGWRRTAVIPDDRSSTGVFLTVFEKA